MSSSAWLEWRGEAVGTARNEWEAGEHRRTERAETVSTGGEFELESRRKMGRAWGQTEGREFRCLPEQYWARCSLLKASMASLYQELPWEEGPGL